MKFAKAPITEAVFELRFVDSISAKDVGRINKALRKKYSDSNATFEFDVAVEPQGIKQTRFEQTGFRLQSKDAADIAIIGAKSIVVARLAPYCGWDTLFERVQFAVSAVVSVAPMTHFSRLGVRFLNRLDVPPTMAESGLGDFFNLRAQNPFSEAAFSEAVQVVFKTNIPDWSARVSVLEVPSPLLAYRAFQLDIDVYREKNIPQKIDDLWNVFTEVHTLKNNIFLQSITDVATALIS